MKITLKEKSKTLFFVYFDDVAWGILPRKKLQAFLHLDLHNIEFNENQINELIKKIKSYAWNKLLDYLSYRERSVQECYEYLKKMYLNHDLSDNLIQRAKDLNYLSNDRFAELYIESLINKGKSRSEIISKLKIKGITSATINKYLDEMYSREENNILKQMVVKAKKRFYNQPAERRREKIISYLSRKGFNYYKIINILDCLEGEDNGFS